MEKFFNNIHLRSGFVGLSGKNMRKAVLGDLVRNRKEDKTLRELLQRDNGTQTGKKLPKTQYTDF